MAGKPWLRRHSIERRLFAWLLALSLVPALLLLALSTWVWTRQLTWFGTLGPWENVAESGRALFDAADSAAVTDPRLTAALDAHRARLSESLVLSRRWSAIGERLAANLPAAAFGIALLLAAAALAVSRKLARQLARPINELVDWTGRIARDEPLPAPHPRERREVREFRVLREAFRIAASDLASARDRAVAAARVRIWGEMARRVAHEMKNPLTPLRLASRRLDAAAQRNPELREPLEVIREETARLEELAGQFAALGRPAAGPRSEVCLRELLSSLVASDVPPGVEATLHAEEELGLVEAHYEEMVRAFRNLLKNAVEATEARPVRRLELSLRDAGTNWVEATIADSGAGIPAGAEAKLFEPDFSTKNRGTGLGLALVRQAIQAHGGVVQVRNRAQGGAEFIVRLPRSGTDAHATQDLATAGDRRPNEGNG